MGRINTQCWSLEKIAKWTPKIDELSNWVPAGNDFNIGRTLIAVEDYSKEVMKYGLNTSFMALAYSILSSRETFAKHEEQYNRVLRSVSPSEIIPFIDNPEHVLSKNQDEIYKILKEYGFHTKKFNALKSAAKGWVDLNLSERLREDERKEMGFILRDEMVSNMNGVGHKFTSLALRMYGYHDLVTVDSWAMKFVEGRGFKFRDKKSGLKPKQYIEYEKRIQEFSSESNVSPALFQATIYGICSTWIKDSGYLKMNSIAI